MRIYELKKTNLKGATVIDGFPSIGLVSSIVANYLVNALHLQQIGIMESDHFPAISLVRRGEPLSTVRIYASERVVGADDETDQLVVFLSEFQPPPNLIRPISAALLDWVTEQRCRALISPEGLVIEREGATSEEVPEGARPAETIDVYGVGSTKRANRWLEEKGIQSFQEGVITGVAGVLLNEGHRREFDVVTILAEAHSNFPDARAAAKVIEIIDKLVLNIELTAEPLYREAEEIEKQIKAIHRQAKSAKGGKRAPAPQMFG
ncbi:MAG TPA: PAC2 family protein [Candidatus Thermoplasmatota archaeon]